MTLPDLASDSARPIWALGRFLIVAELGRGGMAEVYLGVVRGPSGFSKLVVLKLLRAQYADEPQFLEMFLAEARLAARLNHANVVQTYEVAQEGGRQCIVMEYLDGRTLAEIWQQAQMPLPLAVRVLADALAGLHHAHELADLEGRSCRLVHRDVSPQNLIVTYDGQTKVLDFGIAKATDSAAQTNTGMFKGKVRYASPERLVGGAEIDRRADVFSMGVLLWEASTRQRLWHGFGDLAVMRHLASGEPIPPPSSICPDVPAAVDAICERALSPFSSRRYATALEMQDVLEDYLSVCSSVPVTARAVAKFMTDTFAGHRAGFHRTIDEQLRTIANAPVEELPTSMSRIRHGAPRLGGGADALSDSWMPGPVPSPPSVAITPAAPRASQPRAGSRVAALGSAAVLIAGGALSFVIVTHRPTADPEGSTLPRPIDSVPASASEARPVDDGRAALPEAPPASVSAPPTAPLPAPRHWIAPATRAPLRAATATASVVAAPAVEPRRAVDCSSPFYVDDRGVKKIRTECL